MRGSAGPTGSAVHGTLHHPELELNTPPCCFVRAGVLTLSFGTIGGTVPRAQPGVHRPAAHLALVNLQNERVRLPQLGRRLSGGVQDHVLQLDHALGLGVRLRVVVPQLGLLEEEARFQSRGREPRAGASGAERAVWPNRTEKLCRCGRTCNTKYRLLHHSTIPPFFLFSQPSKLISERLFWPLEAPGPSMCSGRKKNCLRRRWCNLNKRAAGGWWPGVPGGVPRGIHSNNSRFHEAQHVWAGVK